MIERITNDVFSERFYHDKSKVNPRTKNNYFPAYHFILSMGAPESPGLSEWKKNKGQFSDVILERSAEVGSAVHDWIDLMIKTNMDVELSKIDDAFPNARESHKVKESLLGFINFMEQQQPHILASESMHTAEDFGFTLDLQARILEDEYASEWVLDWKTSRSVTEDHKMQVEVMRRIVGADNAGIVVLGNTTKKKYTFTQVKKSERDYLWDRFCAIRETAYVELLKRGTIKPRENEIPAVFSLKNINIKRIWNE